MLMLKATVIYNMAAMITWISTEKNWIPYYLVYQLVCMSKSYVLIIHICNNVC